MEPCLCIFVLTFATQGTLQCLAGKVGAAKNNKCVVLLGGLWGFHRLSGRGRKPCMRLYRTSYSVCTSASEYEVQHTCPIEILSSPVF